MVAIWWYSTGHKNMMLLLLNESHKYSSDCENRIGGIQRSLYRLSALSTGHHFHYRSISIISHTNFGAVLHWSQKWFRFFFIHFVNNFICMQSYALNSHPFCDSIYLIRVTSTQEPTKRLCLCIFHYFSHQTQFLN